MKLYIFTLDHLSTVQKGIQAAHVVAELMNDDSHPEHDRDVTEWATDHKTIIMVKGGNHESMIRLLGQAQNQNLPHAYFVEDARTLGGLLTAVAILVRPNDYYTSTGLVNQIQHAQMVVV